MNKRYLYIARCKDKSIYTGITSDVTKRIAAHNKGFGSRWIKQHGEAEIVYTEMYDDYQAAHRRELQIKNWSRKKKEKLINGLKP